MKTPDRIAVVGGGLSGLSAGIALLRRGRHVMLFEANDHYQTEDTMNEGINRFIQFIDKSEDSYLERGNSSKTVGAVVISICGLLTIGGLILWKKGKIEF